MISVKPIAALVLKHPLRSIILFSVFTRLLVLVVYPAVSYFNDSTNYIDLAQLILDGKFHTYDGARTPGYALFLAILGNNHVLAVLVQNIMGIGSIILVYHIAHRFLGSLWSLILCIVLSWYLPFIFYDFAILTESLTCFLFFLLTQLILKFDLIKSSRWIWLFLASLLSSYLFLVKPFFLFVPAFVGLFLLYFQFRNGFLIAIRNFLILISLPIITWHAWNKSNELRTGVYMTSWYEGYNLMQVGTTFYEEIPEEHRNIRIVLVKERENRRSLMADEAMTIWYARKELKEKTGLSELELSLQLKEIALHLILDHPKEYAQQIGYSFYKFYGAESTMLWNLDSFRSTFIRKSFSGSFNYIQAYLLVLLNLSFLILTPIIIWRKRHQNSTSYRYYILFSLLVIAASILQAMITYGTNSRFCYPFTPVILILSCYGAHHLYSTSKKSC